jgi:hypothetical protein
MRRLAFCRVVICVVAVAIPGNARQGLAAEETVQYIETNSLIEQGNLIIQLEATVAGSFRLYTLIRDSGSRLDEEFSCRSISYLEVDVVSVGVRQPGKALISVFANDLNPQKMASAMIQLCALNDVEVRSGDPSGD